MLKRSKTDKTPRYEGPPRLLIVDDNPDAARLLGKLFRREGFEVAEVNDHQVALVALANEPNPISAVVSSFSTAGTGASVKLLDAVRNHHDPRVNTARMVLVIETPRQRVFTWQSGADEILLRPYRAIELIQAVGRAIERADSERPVYRARMIAEVESMSVREGMDTMLDDPTPSIRFS